MHAVAGGSGCPAGYRTSFADTFFQDLAIHGLAVTEHGSYVFRFILLANAGIYTDLFEQIGHAKGACFIGDDRDNARPELRVFHQLPKNTHKRHGGGHFFVVSMHGKTCVAGQWWYLHHFTNGFTLGQEATQCRSSGVQVLHLGRIRCWFKKLQVRGLLIRQRQIETIAKGQQGRLVKFFLAVCGHLSLTSLSHAIAFFGVCQYDSGLTSMCSSCSIGSVDFHQIVAATFEPVNLFVGQALRELRELRVLSEECLSVKAPVFGRKGLHLSIHGAGKSFDQRPVCVACKQSIPVAAPNEFDDVPTRATKQFFQLVNDATIAAYRTIQSLQIAVDHPDQIVQAFARRECEGAHAFWLIHFPVAEDTPDFTVLAIEQTPVCQITHETRMVNGADRTNAHGSGRKLPKVWHQPRMRVTG